MERAKHWYSQTVGSMQGDWETLCSKFCLCFFPISKVVSLRKEVLNFRQLQEESVGISWDCFNELIITGPDLAIPTPMLFQHFYLGLSKDSMEFFDESSRGAFLYLYIREARAMLDRISGKTPCTSIHNELPEKEKKSSPDQEEKVLIAKSQSLQFQDLAINPEAPIPQNHSREEGIPSLEIPVKIMDDLFGPNFGRTLNSHLYKRPLSEYNSNPLKKGSLRNCPYFHIWHQEEFKDGMSSDTIEGEPSPLEHTSILSPSMPTLNVLYEPILDPDDPSYALSPKPHDDPRNPLRQPKHMSHEDQKNDQEVLQQLLECMKNSYAIIKN
jgi:hypothetical protein